MDLGIFGLIIAAENRTQIFRHGSTSCGTVPPNQTSFRGAILTRPLQLVLNGSRNAKMMCSGDTCFESWWIVHDEDGISHNSFGNPFFFRTGRCGWGGG